MSYDNKNEMCVEKTQNEFSYGLDLEERLSKEDHSIVFDSHNSEINNSKNLCLENVFEYKEKERKLSLRIQKFSQLEKILKNSNLLKEYNQKFQSISKNETFFSFLISTIKDVYIKHRICLLFLKYGYTPNTIVSYNMTLSELLCSL